MILENTSEYFSFDSSKFKNEQYKRYPSLFPCVINDRDFNLLDSYTIESSCYGYKPKKAIDIQDDKQIRVLTPYDLLKFGEHLA